MAKITPSLSTRVDARGKSEILLRFVAGRDHIYRLHSSLYITPSRWKDGAVVVPRLETPEQRELVALRQTLEDLSAHLLTAFAEADKDVVDRRWMQKAVTAFFHPASAAQGPARILDAFDLFLEDGKGRIGEKQYKRYKVVRQALARWERYRRGTLFLQTFSKEDVQEYETFIRREHKIARQARWSELYDPRKLPQPRGENTVIQYLEIFRVFWHWAKGNGLTLNEPFAAYPLQTALYGTPYYITLEEVEQLYRADLSKRPGLAVQRDIFVFQCQVGCRVGDLLRFRQSDVSDGVLEYIPGKTKGENPRTVRVPLNTRAREIIGRYADDAYPRLLPFISSQKYNDAIKDAFRLAGLTRQVTVLDPLTRAESKRPLDELASSHLARRTFIGNLYKLVKDPNLIASMSGHVEGSKAFARYRTIDDDIKTELVTALEEKKEG